MQTGQFTAYIDVAQITLYAFWIFFAGLIWYIRQEDRREGYPLENDLTGAYDKQPWLFVPAPKQFNLPHGRGTATAPNGKRDSERKFAMERLSRAPGSPSAPTGDPMLAGVGPGSWAERKDHADLMASGAARIVPMRVDGDFSVAAEDSDPRGWEVIGCDGEVGGTIKDLWIDRSESLIRYLEVAVSKAPKARTVLVPVTFSVFRKGNVYVHAITGAQFQNVPKTKSTDEVTLLEEDKIAAYYGGGQLYATAKRQEPLA
jgi:photosynthetic reaction center H subunit